MTPKPIRCYAIVNAKGQVIYTSLFHSDCIWYRSFKSPNERIIPGRFVPDATKLPPKARKGTR